MVKPAKQKPPGRKCAICGKPGGFPMELALVGLGVDGTYAHNNCVLRKRRQQEAYNKEVANER